MFLSGLSNHDIGGECDFWSSKDSDYCKGEMGSSSYNSMLFYFDISETCDLGEKGERFTKVYNRLAGIWLSIPNKIIRVDNGKTYVHTKIYYSILKDKVDWLMKHKNIDVLSTIREIKNI